MLLPDNIHPKNSIYYNGALVLDVMQQYKRLSIVDLFLKLQEKEAITFPVLVLCLDWLYLINTVVVDNKGEVRLCS
ncbi:MAG: hypothetical protein PHS04_08115 [Tissierellia bacterium]|jgi:hypothetical protein|nr:hypothetical protein [Tissierellia bacterium]